MIVRYRASLRTMEIVASNPNTTLTATADDLQQALKAYHSQAVLGSVDAVRYRCRYVSWGSGPPVVIIPGLSDISLSFVMVMARLASSHRCIAVELASGDHDRCRFRAYRHEHQVEDLAVVLDRLGLPHVDLFGSSFGSTIALRFMATHPHRVRRTVLQGGFARRPLGRIERGAARLARYWPGLMSDLVVRPLVMKRIDQPQFQTAAPEIYRFFLKCSGAIPIEAASRRGLIIHRLDLRRLLPRIPHPVLMIGGDRDGLVPRQYEADVEMGLPNVRRIEIPVCGHYPQYTHPRETAEAMLNFLGSPAPSNGI
ncbi:MAG: alpha/beta hydrolase [Gemmataceae bacterium]